MIKLFRLKWKREIEELESLHRIAMAEKEAEIERLRKDGVADYELKHKEIVTLLKLESEQRIKQIELDHKRQLEELKRTSAEEVLKTKEEVMQKGYDTLTAATQKLHEEGNVTTKFVQDLALSMMKKAPTSKVKVLTGTTK